MQSYGSDSIQPDDSLSFRVSGGSTLPLTALVGAGLLVVAGLVAVRVWFGPRQPSPAAQPVDYISAIARLDDDYEAGAISEQDWRDRRERLKIKALRQMEGSDD